MVQRREKLLRTYEKLLAIMSNYENLSETIKTLLRMDCGIDETLGDLALDEACMFLWKACFTVAAQYSMHW